MEKNMNINLAIAITIISIGLSGCESARMNENVSVMQGKQPSKIALGSKFRHSIKNVEVEVSNAELKDLPAAMLGMKHNLPKGDLRSVFQYLLYEPLCDSGALSKSGECDLKATIITLDWPILGIGSVKATIHYLVHDKTTGSIMFDEIIESSAEATDSLIYKERMTSASVKALCNNIVLFLNKLSS
jgi:hypothetical protein